MPILPPRLVALSAAVPICLISLLNQGCKCSGEGPAPVPSAAPSQVASALPSPEEMTRCRRRPDYTLTLQPEAVGEKPAESASDEDDDALLPFGVDVGTALPTPFGFAVVGMRGAGQAFAALLGARESRRVDLGQLHGDAETPGFTLVGERLIVALRSTDAAGFTIKLGSIAGAESSAVTWGYELSKLGKAVTSVQLAATGERGVLVYQGELKGEPRLLLGVFEPDKLSAPFEAHPLEPKDTEMPRLLARPGGYWLSWVRHLPEPKKPAKPVPDAGSEDPEEGELLDAGLRVLEVAKLDEQGKLQGAALRVGEPRRQVLLYDVARLANGGLLVAARSDSAAPGAEGGALLLSEVGADGSVREERLEDEEIGAGAPELLVDADPKQPGPWLVVSSPSDATRLGLAQGTRTVLRADPLVGRAEVIAVSAGHFLLQRARGRTVVLESLDCSWPADGAAEKK
jgi:hypothetical protein